MSERVLAIDPGPVQSAFLDYWSEMPVPIVDFGMRDNALLLPLLRAQWVTPPTVVIEQVRSMGMAVGAEVFDTVHWSGRFHEAAGRLPVVLVPRHKVKSHLCGNQKAKDANIRQALIDRFGGPASIRKGGKLYGVSKDVWSALALAVTYADGAA